MLITSEVLVLLSACECEPSGQKPGGSFISARTGPFTSKPENAEMTNKTTFNRQRRHAVHQIMCRRDIKPLSKIVARTVAALEFVTDKGSSTPASDMTIAKKAGVKLHEATAAITDLRAAKQLHVAERDGERRIHLYVRDDIERPIVPPIARGDTQFFKSGRHRDHIKRREEWLDRGFADRRLTKSDKLIAYAFLTLTDPHTLRQTEPLQTIGGIVGYSKSTASRSIPHLVKHGYLVDASTLALDVEAPLQTSCKPVADSLQPKHGSAHLTGVSAPPSGFSGVSGLSGLSDKSSERSSTSRLRSDERSDGNRVRFTWIEWERFAQLADLIADNSKGANFKTVAGIMAVSGAIYPGHEIDNDVYGVPYFPDEIQKFVRAGLLARDGQRISVTDLGQRQYDLFKVQEEQAA